jgi:hypothetical protein
VEVLDRPPDVSVAILDTGIEWQNVELVDKIRLNAGELPEPERGGPARREGVDCSKYAAGDDANGDGAFNVADFACDPRVRIDGGDTESDKLLDASDLISAFSDRSDADGNGYADDVAGWDFFDDDNDPFDASSCCNAGGHGTDRAAEAGRATNDGKGEAGLCPECQVMPLRVWDTFVVDTNLFALATVYAADNGASVVEGAVGGLLNSSFARRAFKYADAKGVALTLVSSDINSANHNYPTNYPEAIYVSGSLPDTAPGERCEIPGLPGVGNPTGQGEVPGCKQLLTALEKAGVPSVSGQPPTTSFFRNSNLTQYGGKNDIVLVGSTGSVNTGQASGAAGLLQSYARERLAGQDAFPKSLSGNEIRQLLTMSAEDVLPENTGSIGLPDRAEKGWDTHFGYGRVNLAGAMAMIQEGRIPPEVQLDGPDWFAPINVDKVGDGGVPVTGRVKTPHFDGVRWELGYGCGQQTDTFEVLAAARATSRARSRGCRRRCSSSSPTSATAAWPTTPAAPRAGRPTPGPPTPTPTRTPSATPSRSASWPARSPTTRTSASTARRCTPTATTGRSRAGRSRWAPTRCPASCGPAPAARARRAWPTSTPTTASTSCCRRRPASCTSCAPTARRSPRSTAGARCAPSPTRSRRRTPARAGSAKGCSPSLRSSRCASRSSAT